MGAGASSTKDVLQQNDPGRVPERSPSASDMTEAPTSKTTPSLAAKSTPALGSGGGSAGPKKQAEIDDDNARAKIAEWTEEFRQRRLALHLIFREFDKDDSGAMSKGEFAKMIQTILNEHTLESSSSATDMQSKHDAEIILSFIDQDKSNSIDEMEFIEWIEAGEKKSEEERQRFAGKGQGQKLMTDFLNALIARVGTVCAAIAMLFGAQGKMAKNGFLKIVLAGQLEGEKMNWGDEDKLWYQLQTMCRSKMKKKVTTSYKTSSGHIIQGAKELENVLTVEQIIEFLLVGYIIACEYRNKSTAEKNKSFSLNRTGGKSTHRRLRNILGTCITKKVMPALRAMNKELADDHVREMALNNWFSEYDKDGSDVISKLQLFSLLKDVFEDKAAVPGFSVLEKVVKELDEDGDNMCAKVEFVMWIERLLISRRGRRRKDEAAEVRKRLLVSAERRIEKMYQCRECLAQLFRRYSDQNHKLNVEHMKFCLVDGRALTEKEVTVVGECAQILVNAGRDETHENVLEDDFVSYALKLICELNVAIAQKKPKSKTLVVSFGVRSRVENAILSKRKHCKLAIRSLFRHFVRLKEGEERRLLTRQGFKHMMKSAFEIEFEDAEINSVFTHMYERKGVKMKKKGKAPSRVAEKPFVDYMAKGLQLSYEHKLVFGKRSTCHRKIFEFLEAVQERQTKREQALQAMFVVQDSDSSGTIDANELRAAFQTKAALEEEELTQEEAEELLSIIDVNEDNELKREEFVDFFLDALAHTEANDLDWDKGLNPTTHEKVTSIMKRIMEEMDNGFQNELMAAFDEFSSFNLEEPVEEDEMEFYYSSDGEDEDDAPKSEATRRPAAVGVVAESSTATAKTAPNETDPNQTVDGSTPIAENVGNDSESDLSFPDTDSEDEKQADETLVAESGMLPNKEVVPAGNNDSPKPEEEAEQADDNVEDPGTEEEEYGIESDAGSDSDEMIIEDD